MIAALLARPRLAALLGAFCIAFAAIFVRIADVAPSTATLFRCAYALPPLLLLTVLEERRIGPRSRRQVAVAWIAGTAFGLDLTAFHAAIGLVGAGLATVTANLQVVIVGVAAWLLLGDRPSIRLVVAVPVALGGAVLISGVLGGNAFGDDPALGATFGVVAAAFYAVYLLVLRNGIGDPHRIAGPILDATAASAVSALVVGGLIGDLDVVPSLPAHAWLVAVGLVAQFAGGLLILVSLPRLPALLTSVILLAQPATTVTLSMILLAEMPSVGQFAGIGLVLLALAIVNAPIGRVRRRLGLSAPAA